MTHHTANAQPPCDVTTFEAADQRQARSQFPRGLHQPEGSFRFAMDALLLARFALPAATSKKERTVADLGTGCGVVALAMLLDAPQLTATGLDIDPALTAAAQANAETLGLAERFTARTADLADIRNALPAESFDLVVSNPPYRRADQGRHAATQQRTNALFETAGGLETFVNAAGYLVRNKGRFCCIYPAERLAELMNALTAARLEPKHLRMVHSKTDREAVLVLLEARKNANSGCTIHPPLILYSGEGEATTLTPQALAFCPHLACNARGHQPTGDSA
ncbi:methyltransferase [Desulfovibrio mangrovi]|uniref:tRNA1(Val) (adenine(37)-N6)-methyltransferase n=1 Tax=Desulfovibrio mangrovi TaxID=2976983 RepID=UPI002245FD75|nr:methyltransferase [Desulfovibrio mangrovi]UZP66945.1 methyltransferase [Desulfovibrio mangrovi]